MKISKKSLLTMWSIFALAWLWLMFLSVTAEEPESYNIELGTDPNNAKQHFINVEMIAEDLGDNSSAIIKKNWWVVWIETNNNFSLTNISKKCDVDNDWEITSQDTNQILNYILWISVSYKINDVNWDWEITNTDNSQCINLKSNWKHPNKITEWTERSSILWWRSNKIMRWYNETILWWKNNKIWATESWNSNSILWWTNNSLENWENSIIFWWSGNNINWNNSVIIWSEWNTITADFTTVIWNHNEGNWNKSVVLWQNSKIWWSNSFLWTDGNHPDELTNNNVFVVNWEHGMVVNSKKAHSFAQLTIWGSLVLYYDENAPQCNTETKWVVKVLNNDNKKCLCSCDGSWRNALHDGIMCPFICSNTHPDLPECGHVERDCNGDTPPYSYKWAGASWACAKWTLVEWTGAFFVTTKKESTGLTNYINRSCQSDTWTVVQCKNKLIWDGCPNLQVWKCTWDEPLNADPVPWSNQYPTETTENRAYKRAEYDNQACAYFCNTWFIAYQWKCYECEEWTRNAENPDFCTAKIDCEDGRFWNGNGCEFKWKCTYSDGTTYSWWNIWKIKGQKDDLYPMSWSVKTLKCIDGDKYTWDVIPHTCTYQCQEGYYCNWITCTKPQCRAAYEYNDYDVALWNIYYATWIAGHYDFHRSYTMKFVTGDKNGNLITTSWQFYENYSNEIWCYYRCPEKNRRYVGGALPYRCLNERDASRKKCANSYFRWDYKSNQWYPDYNGQARRYVPLYEYDSLVAQWEACIWTCGEWSIVARGWRISTQSEDKNRWPWFPWWHRLFLIKSSADTCYKPCPEGYIRDKDGKCAKCPREKVIDTSMVSTWELSNSIYSGKGELFIQYSNSTWKFDGAIIEEYRWCKLIDCGSGATLYNEVCIATVVGGKCEPGFTMVNNSCRRCVHSWQMLMSDWNCIDKKSILELNISNNDSQWNTKEYQAWEKITYKVTIKNTWNLTIKNITSTTYTLSGNKLNTPNIGSKSIWELSPWNTSGYTLTYTLKSEDFSGLSTGQTWNFKIKLTVTWTVVDDYIKSLTLVPNPDTLTVTIKKP